MEKDTLSSIEKAVIILEALGTDPYEYKVQALAHKTGFNRSTVYRILRTLEERHLVVFDSDGDKYKIGPGMYHIGSTYLYNNNYKNKIQDILSEIADKTKESVGMAVKDGDKIISIFEIEVHQPMKLNDVPGKYFPVNKGNYGKCIMAYQDPAYIEKFLEGQEFEKTCPKTLTTKEELLREYEKIRRQGYCESIDELGIDIIGAGAPLFDKSGSIKACVAVAFFRQDGWEEKLACIRKTLLDYQKELEKYLP